MYIKTPIATIYACQMTFTNYHLKPILYTKTCAKIKEMTSPKNVKLNQTECSHFFAF